MPLSRLALFSVLTVSKCVLMSHVEIMILKSTIFEKLTYNHSLKKKICPTVKRPQRSSLFCILTPRYTYRCRYTPRGRTRIAICVVVGSRGFIVFVFIVWRPLIWEIGSVDCFSSSMEAEAQLGQLTGAHDPSCA